MRVDASPDSYIYVMAMVHDGGSHWRLDWGHYHKNQCISGGWESSSIGNVVTSPVTFSDRNVEKEHQVRAHKTRDRWSIVRDWMMVCDEQHVSCQRLMFRREPVLPTRMVCTGLGGQTLRVCLVADLPADTRFCTLSHCWGQHVPLKLLKDNMDALRERSPEEKLSNTFRDAIHIATSLGVQYIWIDSLW
jgi:hypothetical protein